MFDYEQVVKANVFIRLTNNERGVMNMKSKRKFMKKEAIWERKKPEYIPYKDLKGNTLSEDEILFCNDEIMRKTKQKKFAIWGEDDKEKENKDQKKPKFYTVHSPGVKLNYDRDSNFPVSLVTPEGELMNLKISAKTKETLPIFAGNAEVTDIVVIGAPSVAKTTYLTQLCDPCFHDLLGQSLRCSVQEALYADTTAQAFYQDLITDFKEGKCAPPTVYSPDTITPFIYYISYRDDDDEIRHRILRLHDVDGEQCLNLNHKSAIFNCADIYLMVSAEELAGNKNSQQYYRRILNQVLQNISVRGNLKDTRITVVITKADLLKQQCDPVLEPALTNSIEFCDGVFYAKSNIEGFSYKEFEDREKAIREFLKKNYTSFYLMLMNNLPETVHFTMIASIGEKTDENNRFSEKSYKPFCIDMPIARTLADLGVARIAVEEDSDAAPKEEKIPGGGFFKKLKEKLKIPEDDEFSDEF